MKNTILQGDCLELMKNIPAGSVDMILTDLPYNITDFKYDRKPNINFQKMWDEVRRILKPCGAAVFFGSAKFSFQLVASNFAEFKYKWTWVKNNPTGFAHAKNCPMRKTEDILVFSDGSINHPTCTTKRMKYYPQGVVEIEPIQKKGQPMLQDSAYRNGSLNHTYTKTTTGYPNDVLYFNSVYNINRNHPSEKPVDLLRYLIRTYTNAGELVLDFCCGSGSTCVAAVEEGRQFIGIELDENYFEIACDRVAKKQEEIFFERT